jgi:prolyl-tRNA synthetase
VLDEGGRQVTMTMGCYGIGVSRVVGAAIEQHHDEQGIVWPSAIAPFTLALIPMQMKKSERVREAAENLYAELRAAGVDVLFDDRDARPGVMFADMELIGIPHRVVIGERGLDKGEVEYRARTDSENQMLPLEGFVDFIRDRIAGETDR